MTRNEMVDRMSSQELSGWHALMVVQAEEAKHHRDMIEARDGIVVDPGRDDDEEAEDEDAEAE
jgi:hypothetical protein